MPRGSRYIHEKRSGKRGTIIRGDQIYTLVGGLIGGGDGQDLHEASIIKRYNVGTRRVTGDGRVFRYAKASNIITRTDFGLMFWYQIGEGIAGNAGGASSIGDYTVILTGTATKDEYAGGYFVAHVDPIQNRLILSNTATSGSTFIITLAEPLTAPIVGGTSYCEAMQNPYGNVRLTAGPSGGDIGGNHVSVAGIPFAITTANNMYLWLQTWGVLFVHPHGDVGGGVDAGERILVFDGEGSVALADDTTHGTMTGTNEDEQIAGYIIDRGGSGPPFVMLTLNP